MKNLFHQKQSISKDHYQLPEDDQINFDPIQSDEEIGPHSRILINNFNENTRIKINIFIDEQQSQKSKTVGKWQKKSVIDPFVTNQKEANFSKSYQAGNTQTVKKLPQTFNQLSETPLKHPQYRYDHTYTRNNPQTVKPNREIDQDNKNPFQGHQAKQNLFQTDIRNKRYYNTQVFPPNKSLIKAPQMSERQKQHKEQIRELLLQMNKAQKAERQNQRIDSSSSSFQQKSYWMPSSQLKQKSFFNASIVQQTKNQHFIQQSQLDKFEQNSMNKQSFVGEQIAQNHSQSQSYRIQVQNKDQQDIQAHESLSEIELQNNHFQQLEQSSIPRKQAEQYVAHTYESRLQEQINENIRLDIENKQSKELQQRSAIQQQSQTVSVKYQQNYQQDSESEISEYNNYHKEQISIQYQTRPEISQKLQNQNEPLQQEFQGDVSVHSSNPNQAQTIYISIQDNESSSMQQEQDPVTDSQHTNQKAIQIDHLSQINIISPRDTQITPQKVGFINFFFSQEKEHSSNDYSNIQEEKQSQPIFQHQVLEFDHQNDEKPQESNEVDSLKLQFTFSPLRENYQKESQRGSYKQLQKYKRLFMNKQTIPQGGIQKGFNKNTKDKEENYSRKSSSKSQSKFTPYSSKSSLHHHKQHCFESSQPQPFKLKDYSGSSSSSSYLHSDRNLRKVQKQQSIGHKNIERQQRKQPKVVKINLKDKTAEDLFTKHKNQFLNKLKHQEKLSNRLISHSPSSKQKINSKLNIFNTQQRSNKQQSHRNRPLSPYIQQLTDRLYSPTSSPVCQHYKKYSRRNLRSKFLDMVEQDPYSMLKQYYFSQEELNQVFVEEILKNELNQIYWIEVVKKYGERKLQNLRRRSKTKYHPNENKIIRQEQKLSDSKRTFANHPYKMNFLNQKVKIKS